MSARERLGQPYASEFVSGEHSKIKPGMAAILTHVVPCDGKDLAISALPSAILRELL